MHDLHSTVKDAEQTGDEKDTETEMVFGKFLSPRLMLIPW